MTIADQTTVGQITEQRDAFAGRLFQSTLALFDVFSIYLGDHLGLYRAIADGGWLRSTELASRTASNERYIREWLEQQAVTGILEVDDATAEPQVRRYHLPAGHAEVLLDRTSLAYLSPMARFSGTLTTVLPQIVDTFRNGGGVPWAAFGDEGRNIQAALNRPIFLTLLATEWLPTIPNVHARLQADPPARVADIGCGAGWSTIAIARAYPKAKVDGFDIDEPSIEMARSNADAEGLSERVTFYHQDASMPIATGRYDLVAAFECIHDMSRPIEALTTMRSPVADGGAAIVVDERTNDTFTAPGDDLERLFYGFSIFCCLPVGMSEQPSAATGTVMRPSTLRRYAQAAGFRDIEILPIEHDTLRAYRLIT